MSNKIENIIKNDHNSLNDCSEEETISSPIDNVKSLLKDLTKDEEMIKNFENKKEAISDNLKCNLNLTNERCTDRFQNIANYIEEWIESTKIEMDMIGNTVEELNVSSNKDKFRKINFCEKNHIFRESMLSVLFFNDKNMKSLYYVILTLYLWLLMWVVVNDYQTTGMFINSNFFKKTFTGWDNLAVYWAVLLSSSSFIVFFIKLIEYTANSFKKINYYIVFSVYFTFQFFIYFFLCIIAVTNNFEFACKLIVAVETARISMKVHGYFREKMLYGLKEYHQKYSLFSPFRDGTNSVPTDIKIFPLITELKKYYYYLLCPSMIYRDTYPRINRHRWRLILAHGSNFVLCILFYYILMRYICDPYFNFSKIKDYYSILHFIFDSLRIAIPGVCFLVVGFFMVLHTWINLWSEILRHGDRRFYEDWWNCKNFEEFYRKWNMVIHEWLYYYVYNDVIRLSLGKLNRFHAKLMVFFLSVVIHELIVWISIGFFFPILSFFFGGPGIIFTYIKPKGKKFNIIFWCKLFIGSGLLLVLYLREINMRNILTENDMIEPWHAWLPRSILMHFSAYKEIIRRSNFY
jgi:sterol O-acyltransferase